MTKPVGSIVSAVVTLGLVAAASIVLPAPATSAAEDCAAAPKPTAPQGQHWYFRTDRKAQRRCWYLALQGQPLVKAAPKTTQQPAPKTTQRAAPAAQSPAPAKAAQTAMAPVAAAPAGPAPATPAVAAPMPGATAPDAKPLTTLTTPPDDVWRAASAVMQRRDQSKPVDADKPAATLANTIAPVAPAAAPPAPAAHNDEPAPPVALMAMETQEPPQSRQPAPSEQPVENPSQRPTAGWSSDFLVFIAGALAAVGVIGLILQLTTARRRERGGGRRVAMPRTAAPKLAPSIFDMQDTSPAAPTFDIKDVPPLAPMEPIDEAARTRELLDKMLRDLGGPRARQAGSR